MLSEPALTQILRPFAEQGVEVVNVAECCGRTYVGVEPATVCRTCKKTPENVQKRTKSPDPSTL